jgi:hypothetical protein
MGEGIQSFGQMEGLLGSDRLSEALRGKVREMIFFVHSGSPSLKCRPRHLHHPKGRPGWCHILTRYVAL